MKILSTVKYLIGIFVLSLLTGCMTPKNVSYFQGVGNEEVVQVGSPAANMIKVEPFDKLSIIVGSKEPALAQLFNLNIVTNGATQKSTYNGTGAQLRDYNIGMNEGIGVYTVSAEGTIDFPVLGQLKVAGMTRPELAGFIKGEIMGRGLINDPTVTVEFMTVGVSVLGEVMHPGRYDMNIDVLTLPDVIALAGDLTITGDRETVKVLRQEGDKVKTYTIDMTDAKNVLQSPVYYLKQGDVVYVEPNTIRKRQTTSNGNNVTNVSFWLSVASLLTSAAILFKK